MMFRFISLGCDSQSAIHIQKRQPSTVTHFFDQLGSTLHGVMKLIEDDFQGFLDEQNLLPLFAENALQAVIDCKYKIDVLSSVHNLDDMNFARVRSVYRQRAQWFRDLFSDESPPTYFVRRWDGRDPDDSDDDPLALLAMLQKRRDDVRLLYLHADPTRPPRAAPGFRSAFLPQPDPAIPHARDLAWQDALLGTAMSRIVDDGG
ncbi:MAG: DUF1796 family putative cysteine peptidase, partial [Janthinobacterium lividum]